MRQANVIGGLFLLALSGFVFWKAKGFPDLADDTPGPGMFPAIVAVAMAVLVGIMLLENRRTKDTRPIINVKSPDFLRALAVGALLVGYIAVLEMVGFLVATPLALLGTMLIVNRDRIWLKVLATALTTGGLYGIFQVLLKVPLP